MFKSISFKVAQLALIAGCLTLGYSTKASAEVNMKLLNSVVKSCQDNPPANKSGECVTSRYDYTLFMSKYNSLKNLGDLRPGFPSSLAVYSLAHYYYTEINASPTTFLDCMVSKDANSSECSGLKVALYYYSSKLDRAMQICSSCFEAYFITSSNWRESMTKDLINWFYELDKPSRKLVVDSISNRDFMRASDNEAGEARQLYLKIKEKVERETQEQKRRDLLQ